MSLQEAISDIYAGLSDHGPSSPEYRQKMLHEIPDAESLDRIKFISEQCKDKSVLHLGCVGPAHSIIEDAAKKVWGIDKVPKEQVEIKNYICVDLEDPKKTFSQKVYKTIEVVVCSEILEHLSNPGILLTKLQNFNCPIIITVPSAFSAVGWEWVLKKKTENVNKDHVAYYSYWTLKTLVERYNFEIKESYWYNGQPLIAEGLIFVVERKK